MSDLLPPRVADVFDRLLGADRKLQTALGELTDWGAIHTGTAESKLIIDAWADVIAVIEAAGMTPPSKASAQVDPAAWFAARYPGDADRTLNMVRRGELGCIRIQDYFPDGKCPPSCNRFRVGAFLPGRTTAIEGDTPKTEPEVYLSFSTPANANQRFEQFVEMAKSQGWSIGP